MSRPWLLPLPVILGVLALGGCPGDDDGAGGTTSPAERTDTAAAAPPSPAITRSELREHLAALQRIADRNGGTRAAGTPGYDQSADYVAARLEDAGWRVTRQDVPFTYWRLGDATLTVGGRELTRADDFQVLSYSGSGRATGDLRDVGLGCDAGDFDGLESGEIPLVERGECFSRVKARNAERAGARALVIQEEVKSRRGVPSATLAAQGIGIPVVEASTEALGTGADGARAAVDVDAASRAGRAQNVIAETPGGNAGHVIMAGGHLDSVAGGPGIDDNGSGDATLIEAAEAIGPDPPGARVRLGFWAAEELGLAGSRRYVRSLDRAERDRIDAYINLDMVGSPNPVPDVYSDGDRELAHVLREADGGRLGEVSTGGASDHTYFDLAGIPVNGLYTGSSESGPGGKPRDPCYHLACDTVDNVDLPMLLRMARTIAAALRTLSERHK
ncbi:MAG TPA: M20/M25/M40 family metallo-hydrolase [Thermoleophilaceae bacterium]|nr:M20/M25/M40 family metallo-hydrolase [Thermoleophilaceae bacterium]